LVLEHALRPLFSYLHAVPVPTAVFAASEDFGSRGLADRVARAAGELADAVLRRPRLKAVDPFEDVTPFERLLEA
jgi:FMN reductase